MMTHASRSTSTSLVDILDRVLDKGIVIDATVRVSLIGIDLLGVDAQITMASFQTYLQLSEDPRAYEVGLIAGAPRRSLPASEGMDPVEPRPSLGGRTLSADPEELSRAAFREDPPEEEDPVGSPK